MDPNSQPPGDEQEKLDHSQYISKAEYDKLVGKLTGLQGFVDKVKEERDAAQTTLSQLQVELAQTQDERKTFAQKQAELERERDILQATARQAIREKEIGALIAKEFDILLEPWSEGLLSDAHTKTDEELTAYLQRWASHLGKVQSSAINDAVSGGTPPAPKAQAGKMTEADILDEMMRTNVHSERYQQLRQMHLELIKK